MLGCRFCFGRSCCSLLATFRLGLQFLSRCLGQNLCLFFLLRLSILALLLSCLVSFDPFLCLMLLLLLLSCTFLSILILLLVLLLHVFQGLLGRLGLGIFRRSSVLVVVLWLFGCCICLLCHHFCILAFQYFCSFLRWFFCFCLDMFGIVLVLFVRFLCFYIFQMVVSFRLC